MPNDSQLSEDIPGGQSSNPSLSNQISRICVECAREGLGNQCVRKRKTIKCVRCNLESRDCSFRQDIVASIHDLQFPDMVIKIGASLSQNQTIQTALLEMMHDMDRNMSITRVEVERLNRTVSRLDDDVRALRASANSNVSANDEVIAQDVVPQSPGAAEDQQTGDAAEGSGPCAPWGPNNPTNVERRASPSGQNRPSPAPSQGVSLHSHPTTFSPEASSGRALRSPDSPQDIRNPLSVANSSQTLLSPWAPRSPSATSIPGSTALVVPLYPDAFQTAAVSSASYRGMPVDLAPGSPQTQLPPGARENEDASGNHVAESAQQLNEVDLQQGQSHTPGDISTHEALARTEELLLHSHTADGRPIPPPVAAQAVAAARHVIDMSCGETMLPHMDSGFSWFQRMTPGVSPIPPFPSANDSTPMPLSDVFIPQPGASTPTSFLPPECPSVSRPPRDGSFHSGHLTSPPGERVSASAPSGEGLAVPGPSRPRHSPARKAQEKRGPNHDERAVKKPRLSGSRQNAN
ncbi:hypothetical protein C8Q76DRAFT_790782 [Earliella scabrosa]|nr:hypothetical protein C8Q76DRAFT_790782 [Earliella scabrosa]